MVTDDKTVGKQSLDVVWLPHLNYYNKYKNSNNKVRFTDIELKFGGMVVAACSHSEQDQTRLYALIVKVNHVPSGNKISESHLQ